MKVMAQTLRMLDMVGNAQPDRLTHLTVAPGQAAPDAATAAVASSAPAGPAENVLSLKQDLIALRREHSKLQQAIYEAAQVQRRLCAPREFLWGDFEIAGEIFPVRHLTGDFFKVMELDSALGLVLGDIAGKGLTAGIWQAHLMGLIQRSARTHTDPADVVAEVNRQLCHDEGAPPITALFFARLDLQDNVLVFCNAGLPAPLLFRHKQPAKAAGSMSPSREQFGVRERIEPSASSVQNASRWICLEEGGPMLGAVPDARFSSGSVRMDPGDMLIAFSDGATECRNSQDEEFETRRLAAAAGAVLGTSANQALFSTLGAVLDFAGTCQPGDDLTLLVIRRRSAITQEPSAPPRRVSSRPSPWAASVKRPKKGNRRGNGSK
jgi:phosphoserine phosphatase RsbU/P